jgi:hypothetical protein
MIELQRVQDRVQQLLEVLGADEDLSARLMAAFGLAEKDHAVMLGMLYRRDVVTRDGLYTVLYGDEAEHEWPNDKIMDQRLFKLRASLKVHSIEVETVRALGWRISKEAKASIKRTVEGPTHEEIVERYRSAFGLQPKQARILALMMGRPAVTAVSLQDIVSGYGAARLQIHRMRRTLAPFGIDIIGNHGRWSLGTSDRSIVETMGNAFCNRRPILVGGR